eukprot:TRINITY_DN33809_c1_g2_i1.p1 TRINITY_DN33809_c1_g2~~TRINITY_DN33809_c1_g2_i1.p1  ORF type:complete len:141 (+),score=46.55 TRINITY_DN33809_c1_g2_i1:91-513(+)
MKVKIVRKAETRANAIPDTRDAKPTAKLSASGGTLLKQKAEASKDTKGVLTRAERQARNKRFAAEYREEMLRKAFGRSRDWDPVNRKTELVPEEYRKDESEVVPTRKKVSKVDANVQKLSKKTGPKLKDLMNKALSNLGS